MSTNGLLTTGFPAYPQAQGSGYAIGDTGTIGVATYPGSLGPPATAAASYVVTAINTPVSRTYNVAASSLSNSGNYFIVFLDAPLSSDDLALLSDAAANSALGSATGLTLTPTLNGVPMVLTSVGNDSDHGGNGFLSFTLPAGTFTDHAAAADTGTAEVVVVAVGSVAAFEITAPGSGFNAYSVYLTTPVPPHAGSGSGMVVQAITVGDPPGSGCGACNGPRLLNIVPGWSDLPDSVLAASDPSFALHVGEIAFNAAFGMVRLEIFPCILKHGDTVPLPVSCADGYAYSREELIYLWTVSSSTDPSTNWISGPDCLWFTNWNVDQATGVVFSEEWYERSSGAGERFAAKSNDGAILVFTIGQRQKTHMMMAAPASYTSVDESLMATDKPLTQALVQALSKNAKFGAVNSEVFWLGEYIDGQTVTLPVSPVDGYAYSAAECKFLHSWRWTAQSTVYQQPPSNYDQLCPFKASVSSSGVVSISVSFMHSSDAFVAPGYGRIAVFAFATRSATPTSAPLADDFTELDLDFFAPGRTLRASTLLTIKRNTDEAILSPEFFGPFTYANGATVPLPVSPVDGYAYTREEIQYLWTWADTTNQTGTHLRLPLFLGSVDQLTGAVALQAWRLPDGGPILDDNNTLCRISVLMVATRQASHAEVGRPAALPPAGGGGGAISGEAAITILGAAPVAEVDLAPSGDGDFTASHSLGVTPALVLIQMTSGGNIWLRGSRYDSTTIYLSASADGITGKALLFTTAPAAEIALAPSSDGDFIVPHSLGATPGLVMVQMTSGGNLWSQPAVADNSHLYLTASDGGVTGYAEAWLQLIGTGSPSIRRLQIPLSASADGNFQVAHGLGLTPLAVLITMSSPGFPAFWFQATRYDDVNIYLVSPGAGVAGFAEVLY